MRDKMMIGGCCVCSDERGWAENPLVYCDGQGCNVAVHQACYGIVTVPTGPWFCRKCESQERSGRLRCELCPSKDGALKRTDRSGWAHVVCALYIPEVRFGNVTTMEPILVGIIPPERFGKSCYICEQQGKEGKASIGACMQCNKSGCKQSFHVTCAQALGLLCEEAGNYLDNVKYCGYCQYHYSKLKKGGNVKTIPPYKPITGGNSSGESPEKENPSENKTLLRKRNKPVPNTTSNAKVNVASSAPCAKLSALNSDSTKGEDGGDRSQNIALNKTERPSDLNNGPTKFTTANFTETVVTESESVFGNGPSSGIDTKPTEKISKPKKSTNKQLAVSPISQSGEISATDSVCPQNDLTVKTSISESSVPVISSSTSVQFEATVSLSNSLIESVSSSSNTSVSTVLSNAPTPSYATVYENFFGNVAKPNICASIDGSSPAKRTSSVERRAKKPRRGGRKGTIGRPPKELVPKLEEAYSSPSSPGSVTESVASLTRKGRKRKTDGPSLTAAHMLGNELNPASSMAQHMTNTLNSEIEAHPMLNKEEDKEGYDPQCESSVPGSLCVTTRDTTNVSTNSIIGPTYPGKNVSTSRSVGPQPFPHSLEQLLERQWEQGSQFLMEQAQHFDIASLLSCLHQLRQENVRLEEHVSQLGQRRDHLLAVNARLAVPLNFHHSNNNLGTTTTSTFSGVPNAPQVGDHHRNRVTSYLPMENGILDHPKVPPSAHVPSPQSSGSHGLSPLSVASHGPSPQSFGPVGPPTQNNIPVAPCPTTSSHPHPSQNHSLPLHSSLPVNSINLSTGMSLSTPGGYVTAPQSLYLPTHHPPYRSSSGSAANYHGNSLLSLPPAATGSPSNLVNSTPRSSITPGDMMRCNSVERPNSSLSQYSGYQMISPPLSLTSSSSGSGSVNAQSIQRDLLAKCNSSDKR